MPILRINSFPLRCSRSCGIACNCSCMTAAFQTMVTPLFIGVSYSENWIPFLRMTVSAIFSIMPSCTLYR